MASDLDDLGGGGVPPARVPTPLPVDPQRAFEARLLRAARLRRGLAPAQVCCALAISPRTLGYWEAGTRQPALRRAAALCAVLGLAPGELLDTAAEGPE